MHSGKSCRKEFMLEFENFLLGNQNAKFRCLFSNK
jgi:hypothetical protein